MIDDRLLKNEEKAVFSLRSLYKMYGYRPYKMSKFEEYELYIRNKDFLVSDRIITFNDTNGKLMALKPDVTLSIIKNSEDAAGFKQKVYYNENVYRISESTKHFKEIMQSGIECIGDIDFYDVFEVISLATQSLEKICEGKNFVLEISHLGILLSVLSEIKNDVYFIEKATKFISEKNAHDLKKLCDENGICNEEFKKICVFINSYGERKKVLEDLKEICHGKTKKYYDELNEISEMIDDSELSENIIFDFSVVNDMNYYNSIVFKGFLKGICDGVLSGGRYDRLMEKMGRKCGGVGFAVYIDLLEQLKGKTSGHDADVLLVYDGKTDAARVKKAVEKYVKQGRSVSAQKTDKTTLRYKEIIYLSREGEDA